MHKSITFAVFCIQIFYVQQTFSQTVTAPSAINKGHTPSLGPNIPGIPPQQITGSNLGLAGQNIGIAGPNIGLPGPNIGINGAGLSGQMLAAMSGPAFGPLAGQALNLAAGQPNPMGIPAGIVANSAGKMANPAGIMANPAGIIANPAIAYGPFGGNGNGDVAVTGELPVAGTTAISGKVPLTGRVQFTGNVPAAGVVTISGQCSYGNGPYNPPYATKPAYNKPYLY